MLKIAIVIGSTRPGRNGEAVAKWAYDVARQRNEAEFELVDVADFNPPLPCHNLTFVTPTKTWRLPVIHLIVVSPASFRSSRP